MIEVNSSTIKAIGFDNGLKVQFKNGIIYNYPDVPATLFEDFTKAESKGKYFSEYIRNKYKFNKEA